MGEHVGLVYLQVNNKQIKLLYSSINIYFGVQMEPNGPVRVQLVTFVYRLKLDHLKVGGSPLFRNTPT